MIARRLTRNVPLPTGEVWTTVREDSQDESNAATTTDMRPATPRRRSSALVRDESGQGVVEFALILPILLLVLVGIIEFGAIYSKVISMRQGVREAGRAASVGAFGNAACPTIGSPNSGMPAAVLPVTPSQLKASGSAFGRV